MDVQGKRLHVAICRNRERTFFLTTGGSRAATIACSSQGRNPTQLVTSHNFTAFECSSTDLIKYILEALLRECRALDVLDRTQLPRQPLTRLKGHRPLLLPSKLFGDSWVIAEIDLCADDQARHTGAVVVYLGEPLFLDVLKGCRRCDGEAHQEDVGLRVGQRSQAVVVLLTCRRGRCMRDLASATLFFR